MLTKQTAYRATAKHLYFDQELSCADLSEVTNKSLPLASSLPRELIEENIVLETGYGNLTCGNRPLYDAVSYADNLIAKIFGMRIYC